MHYLCSAILLENQLYTNLIKRKTIMKQRTIFIYCMTLVLLVGLISCEGGKLEKNLLINLPQLSEEITGTSLADLDALMQKKGYTRWLLEGDDDDFEVYYINGLTVDNTVTLETLGEHINQPLTENATIVAMLGGRDEGVFGVLEMMAFYILPNETSKQYKTLSNNTYSYYTSKFPFVCSATATPEIEQMFQWGAMIADGSEDLSYTNQDLLISNALSCGLITQEVYDRLIQQLEAEQNGNRDAFVEQLSQATGEIVEEYVGYSHAGEHVTMSMLIMLAENEDPFGLTGLPVVHAAWVSDDMKESSIATPLRGKLLPMTNPLIKK